MSLWTKRHAIPKADFHSVVAEIVFEGKIWIVCDVRSEKRHFCITEIFVFDPESKVFTEKHCVNPEFQHDRIKCLAADEKNLYMWRSPKTSAHPRDLHLFKLDRTTMEWESVLTISHTGHFPSIVIINQIMYILEVVHYTTYEVYLIRIDLEKREVVDIRTLVSTNDFGTWFGCLSLHNNQLFLMEGFGKAHNVYEIHENGEIKEVAREEQRGQVRFFDKNVAVSNPSELELEFKVHTFDFNSLTWESEITSWWDDNWHACNIRIYESLKVNGSIYFPLRRKENGFQLELHELDLHPKLTSICLESLKSRILEESDEQTLNEVKQKLPIHLRAQLEEQLEWNKRCKK